MTTDRTTRLAAFALAVLMSFAINGVMLWQFDSLAQNGVLASAEPAHDLRPSNPDAIAARS